MGIEWVEWVDGNASKDFDLGSWLAHCMQTLWSHARVRRPRYDGHRVGECESERDERGEEDNTACHRCKRL